MTDFNRPELRVVGEFTTPKGTKLPIHELNKKQYMKVPYRVKWFREEHPDWGIETEGNLINGMALVKAKVLNEGEKVIATGTATEAKEKEFFVECAETAAIGRALALAGFGTQFAAEITEGGRLADSPVTEIEPKYEPPKPPSEPMDFDSAPKTAMAAAVQATQEVFPGAVIAKGNPDYQIKFGKYKGKRLAYIPRDDLVSYCEYLRGMPKPSRGALELIKETDLYLQGSLEADVPH